MNNKNRNKLVEIEFKDGTKRFATYKQLQFILGIKNIKNYLKTYQPVVTNKTK